MDLDDVLHHAGDWGKYQHLLLWLVCLPACIPCGFAAFNQVFMDRVPDAWCKIPELMSAEWSPENRKTVSIPKLVIIKRKEKRKIKFRVSIISILLKLRRFL
jgi:hypothetical protein